MPGLLACLLLPLRQIADPAFRRPLFKGLLSAVLAFGALVWLADWSVGALLGGEGWIATLAGVLGGVLVLISALWLFVPVLLGLVGLFLDEVAAAVEARYYPGLPPAEGASLAAQLRANLGLALKVLLLTLVVLPLALLMPLVGVVVFWVVAAVSLGDGLFEGVAQRRMSVAEASQLRRRRRLEVWSLGGVLALLASVPVVNLLVPVLGTAAMTHLLHRRGAAGASP
jgi:uncharacterized protein involved in cysteine biosynthesis